MLPDELIESISENIIVETSRHDEEVLNAKIVDRVWLVGERNRYHFHP
jgi:hypothetical protein